MRNLLDLPTQNGTHQEAVGQPIVQEDHNIGDDANRGGVDEELVSKRSWRYEVLETSELSVIDICKGQNVEVRPRVDRHEREHNRGMDHESPLDATLCAIRSAEQRSYALEEQVDDDP
jgi:hypothetical protein